MCCRDSIVCSTCASLEEYRWGVRVRSSFGTSLARGAQVVTVCLSPGRLSTCKLQPCVVGVVASSKDEGGGEEVWGNGSWLYLNPRARRSAGPGSVPSDSSAERREISVPEMADGPYLTFPDYLGTDSCKLQEASGSRQRRDLPSPTERRVFKLQVCSQVVCDKLSAD